MVTVAAVQVDGQREMRRERITGIETGCSQKVRLVFGGLWAPMGCLADLPKPADKLSWPYPASSPSESTRSAESPILIGVDISGVSRQCCFVHL